MQADLNLAKQRLIQKNLSLVIAKNSRVLFETESHGISGLLKAIKQLQDNMAGSSVADRIVGQAAALLLVYSGVIAVFAVTASDGGIEVLKNNHVFHEFGRRVPRILDSKRVDVCPFERLVAKFSDPKQAYEELKAHCP
jgi:putative heme degradation protein